MNYENEATHIRRELLARVARLFFEGRLAEGITQVPLEMRPKGHPSSRCCLHKDRVILRYRLLAVLGLEVEVGLDEPVAFADYVASALERDYFSGPPLTVISEACSACVAINYFITNACRGCLARPCQTACAKDAIDVFEGQARIDHAKCVSCGRCQPVCPYHAIVFIPIPCEQACPTGAIKKDDSGKERIDYDLCIFCGLCMKACPFGALMERSELIDVLCRLQAGDKLTAMLAPAVMGQFRAGLERIAGAIQQAGFAAVVEVAIGADETARREAEEFVARMGRGDRLMTTSCCPAYTEAVIKHVPELKPFVSDTRSPMYYTAERVKAADPTALTVFIGPCVAKRAEGRREPLVDYVLTFEELAAILEAKGLDPKTAAPTPIQDPASHWGRGFPLTGGVAAAVAARLEGRAEVRVETVSGLTQKGLKQLKDYAEKCPGNLLEVMACEGGCIAGPAVIESPKLAAPRVQAFAKPKT